MLTLEKAYQILQVSPDASDEEIKKAYRARAKELHPDTNANDPFAEVNFQYLQEAMAKIEEDRKVSYNSAHTEYQSQSSHQNKYSSHNTENENHSEYTEGSNFASDRSSVLKRLNEVYSFVKKRKYRKIEESTDCRELAYKCAYGTLLRHALECIVHDKAIEIHVITEGRSSDELLSFIIDNYPFDVNTKKIFYDAKFITNKLTHIEHFSYSQITFESCQEFYNKRFKQIIETHLSSNKKRTQSYLRKIYEQLENFDVKSRITSTLLLGSVMRQLLECIVDLWLYNESLVCEDKANIKDKLDVLRFYLQNVGSKQTYYTYSTLDNLHAIRIAVNQAMHVSPDNKMNISKIRSGLMAQTSNLDIEIEMPTEKQKRKMKNRFSWKKALLWIFFFPIMLAITIGKSKMGTLLKVILIYSCIQMALGMTMLAGYGIFDALPNFIQEKTATVITIDVEEMSHQLISGYNNYGYFSEDEFTETMVIKENEYVITIKKDYVDEDGTYFVLVVKKNNTEVGEASIRAICPQYLSNGDVVEFEIDEQIDGRCRIKLINSTATVRNLENVEVIRHDPRDYFTIICNREESDGWWHHEWNKFELSESEYTVGDKTVRLSIIEDKRPGAQEVAPGLKFEIFDTNNILLASGSYTFTNLQYNANYDDYGNTDKYSFEFKANFEQVEVLGKTGILIVDTVMEYDFYN